MLTVLFLVLCLDAISEGTSGLLSRMWPLRLSLLGPRRSQDRTVGFLCSKSKLSRSTQLSVGTTATVWFIDGLATTCAQLLPLVTSSWEATAIGLMCFTGVFKLPVSALNGLVPASRRTPLAFFALPLSWILESLTFRLPRDDWPLLLRCTSPAVRLPSAL